MAIIIDNKYGFFERNNCYFSINKKGLETQWSNFVMRPLYHKVDEGNSKRAFQITNEYNFSKVEEIDQADLSSARAFKTKMGKLGHFIWNGNNNQLIKLKEYLYEQTISVSTINQLGWNNDGFFAFSNGIIHNNLWIPANEYGIVDLPHNNHYLISTLSRFKNDNQFNLFDLRFIHEEYSYITLKEYVEQFIRVFGNHAKVGICYLLATLFHDVVKATTRNFPFLYIFRPTGEDFEFENHLTSFFICDNTAIDIQNLPTNKLESHLSNYSNILIHINDRKNKSNPLFLKCIYEGREWSSSSLTQRKQFKHKDCGIILSGENNINSDLSLYSIMLICDINCKNLNQQNQREFNKLSEMRKLGCSHLTLEILKYRKKFEEEFPANYKIVMNELAAAMPPDTEERVYRNWIIPLAAFRTLMYSLELPFDYQDLFKISTEFMSRQNKV